jgi:hypothetical protein
MKELIVNTLYLQFWQGGGWKIISTQDDRVLRKRFGIPPIQCSGFRIPDMGIQPSHRRVVPAREQVYQVLPGIFSCLDCMEQGGK